MAAYLESHQMSPNRGDKDIGKEAFAILDQQLATSREQYKTGTSYYRMLMGSYM